MLVLENAKTRKEYFAQQLQFIKQHSNKDIHARFSTDIILENYKAKVLLAISKSSFFRISWFWIFTLIGLTVPFRIWLAHHCDELRVTLVKETSSTPPPPPHTRNVNGQQQSESWYKKSFWFLPSLSSKQSSQNEVQQPNNNNSHFRQRMEQLYLYNTTPRNSVTTTSYNHTNTLDLESSIRKAIDQQRQNHNNATNTTDTATTPTQLSNNMLHDRKHNSSFVSHINNRLCKSANVILHQHPTSQKI